GTPAFAADMGVPSAPPPAPVYNWTGWYVGVNAGASFGKAKTDFNDATTLAATAHFAPPFLGDIPGTSNFGLGFSDTSAPGGFIGGGQIGYNWQYSPIIVVGLEADIQGALERDSATLTHNFTGSISGSGPCDGIGATCSFTTSVAGSRVLDYQTKID